MAISFVGFASGVTSATLPTHQAGDIIIGLGFRSGSNSTPTVPGGWTTLQTNTTNSSGAALAYIVATGPGTSSGTWTNATHVVFEVYRPGVGTIRVGGSAVATGNSSSVSYPTVTMANVNGGSWVVGMAGHRTQAATLGTAPTGMTNRNSVNSASGIAAGHDTNGGVSSWSATAVSVGQTNGWVGFTVEIYDSVIVFGSASNTTYASRTNTTVTAPTGIANGDVLIAQILTSASVSVTPPSGWTQAGTTATMTDSGSFVLESRIYTKQASGESGDYTWTHSTASSQGMILRYSGTGLSATPNAIASNVQNSPNNTNNVGSSITTTVNNCMLVFMGNDWGATSSNLTPPSGMMERVEVNPLIYAADQILTTAAATGTRTMTCNSGLTDPRNAWMIAIGPAGGSGVTVNPTGSSASTANGNESVVGKANVSPTGQAATASRGSVTVSGKARVTPTGQSAASARGSVTVFLPDITVNVTGSVATTASGTVTAGAFTPVTVYLEGWSYLGWGDQGWGEATFETGGMTGSVGNVEVTGKPTVYPTGRNLTLASGNPLITSAPDVYVDGVALVADIGPPDLSLDCTLFPTGMSMTVTQNASGILVEIPVVVTGVEMTTAINEVDVFGHAWVWLEGNQLTTGVGQAYVAAWDRIPDKNNDWTPVNPSGTTWTPVSTVPNNWTPVIKG